MKPRYTLFPAAISLLVLGAFLVVLPFGVSSEMQDGTAIGLVPATILGILAFVSGVALLILGLVGSIMAGWRVPAAAAPANVPDPEGAPPGPSSEVEAAIVRLLNDSERLLYLRLRDTDSEVLQRDVVGWGTFSAAKVSRLLDRLERKGLIVRERHGMTNRVRLLHRPVVPGK